MIYDFTNPPIYLDLGGALAAFGLIFVVYQLRKPQWELILKIRSGWQRHLPSTFVIAGLLLVLLRVVFPRELLECLPYPLNIPLSYEVMAYFFFIVAPSLLLYLSTTSKGLFKRSPRKFYELLVWEISKATDENVHAALGVLLQNFEDICKAASRQARRHKQDEEVYQSASAILAVVLSETTVVKILTTKKLGALQSILEMLEQYNIKKREVGIGVSGIVRNLFCDKESFFYKHLDREGLALPLNIYETIFGSTTMLTNFALFDKYQVLNYSWQKDIDELGIRVLIEALSHAIETYLKTGKVPPRHINDGFSYLSEIFWNICQKIRTEEERRVDIRYVLKHEWDNLNTIAHFLGHSYPFLAYQDELNRGVVEKERSVVEASFHSNSAINAGVAAALYKAFEGLSFIDDTADTYDIVGQLLFGAIYEDSLKEGYREPLLKILWEQVGRNIIRRHYPAVLRTYLVLMGHYLASEPANGQGWFVEEVERVRRLLYVDLKPLLDRDVEMVNNKKMKGALLPPLIDYKNGQFTYKFGFGDGPENIISAPPEGSASALEGVDLEHRSIM